MHIHTHRGTHTHTQRCTHTLTSTHIHTQMHTHTHREIQTQRYTHTRKPKKLRRVFVSMPTDTDFDATFGMHIVHWYTISESDCGALCSSPTVKSGSRPLSEILMSVSSSTENQYPSRVFAAINYSRVTRYSLLSLIAGALYVKVITIPYIEKLAWLKTYSCLRRTPTLTLKIEAKSTSYT